MAAETGSGERVEVSSDRGGSQRPGQSEARADRTTTVTTPEPGCGSPR